MGALLEKMRMGADDKEDMIVITLGQLRPMVPYQTGFEIAHRLRMKCKEAARYDKAPASFWREMPLESLDDCPKPHEHFRRSKLVSNVDKWDINILSTLVQIWFNDHGTDMGYEEGIRLHHTIRRAARRAAAWAGETRRYSAMLGMLSDPEEDDKLGLA